MIRLLIRRLKNDCVIFECRTTGGCGNNLTIGPRTAKPNLLIGRYYRKRKTEVYLQVIAEVLNQGKTAIMLVPEISLTPQMVQRFKSRFGEHVAVMHSGLSQGEKYDEWRKIERGEAEVVVGARSAILRQSKTSV